MNNYEYIVASLPVVNQDNPSGLDVDAIIEEIREQLSSSDRSLLDLFLKGYDQDSLGRDFYLQTRSSGNRFIRDFFNLDLAVRNARVAYINSSLGRPESQDIVILDEEGQAEEEICSGLDEILRDSDILRKERAMDNYIFARIDEMSCFDLFNLNFILATVAKLKIVQRWIKLDPVEGEKMFREMVGRIRSTYDNKKQHYI
ncbi:MAG: DUF2764 family protein [Bacteroidales bacterium]|nr:DUF2764 family protein [Bacteroidales bacterium]MDD6772587.1 DUF2764 family protein [Bacteroidales bacterium]